MRQWRAAAIAPERIRVLQRVFVAERIVRRTESLVRSLAHARPGESD